MHSTWKSTNAYSKIHREFMMCHLPLKLVKKSQYLHKRTLLSIQSIHWKHNNIINKHSNNHTNKWRKHTKPQTIVLRYKGLWLATRAWVGQNCGFDKYLCYDGSISKYQENTWVGLGWVWSDQTLLKAYLSRKFQEFTRGLLHYLSTPRNSWQGFYT